MFLNFRGVRTCFWSMAFYKLIRAVKPTYLTSFHDSLCAQTSSATQGKFTLYESVACGSFGLETGSLLPAHNVSFRRHFCTSLPRTKREDRKEMLASLPRQDEGTEGEKHVEIDTVVDGKYDVFPDENTPNMLINGVRFAEIPICHIKATPNNTIIALTSAKGEMNLVRSCGMEGFKNTRKGTNIAAQATAVNFGLKATERGYSDVRVKVQGLGPGRMSAIKGLTMGGLNVVSITDTTPVSWEVSPRPKKQRKL